MKSEEIAKIAGVSRSTVSRVINNYTNVPEETRNKVLEVIEKYNYQPNTCARVLAGKKTNTIGLFLVSMAEAHNLNKLYNNNYFNQFVDAVVDFSNARGFYVLVNIIYCEHDYNNVKNAFLQKRIDGAIIIGTEIEADILLDISKKGCPIAITDFDADAVINSKKENENLIVVGSKDYEGATAAVEYLIELGHTDIAILAGRLQTYSGKRRYEAYFDTMKKHGLKVDEEFVIHGGFIRTKAGEGIKKLIENGKLPTAIFSSNDDMAVTAMNILKEHNILVPEDISIIGFDDIQLASLIKPALTTVATPVYEMVEKTVEEIILNIKKEKKGFSTYEFDTKIVIRDTCVKKK